MKRGCTEVVGFGRRSRFVICLGLEGVFGVFRLLRVFIRGGGDYFG